MPSSKVSHPAQAKSHTKPRAKSRPTHISRTTRASFWQNAQLVLLMALPATLFFSYYPIIPLGSTTSMNFELSLPLIWLALFNLCSIFNFWQSRRSQATKKITPHLTYILALLAFPLYLTLSCLWSANPIRGLLTVGIFWLVLGAIAGTISLLYHTLRNKSIVFPAKLAKPTSHPCQFFCKILLISAIVVSAFCWLQCLLDLAGVSREATLMCAGCTYHAFGFPHPSGFAIEPQFMGGLLLAPTLLSLYLWQTRRGLRYFLCAFFLSATLFLTFSRGAIYAFAIGILFILIYLTVYSKKVQKEQNVYSKQHNVNANQHPAHSKPHPRLRLISAPIIAFAFTLLAQGTFAMLSPTSDTFITGVTKSIHHLSLGLIDLRPTTTIEVPFYLDNYAKITLQSPAQIKQIATISPENTNSIGSVTSAEDAIFDGYAAISTDTRVRLTNYALDIWRATPVNTFFGTGLGSAGTKLYEHYPELGSPKEIVQNEYVSLLLETGLLGYVTLAISGITLILILRHYINNIFSIRLPYVYWFALVLAFGITICFFSGLPNALHVYLLTPLIPILLYFKTSQKSSLPSHKNDTIIL